MRIALMISIALMCGCNNLKEIRMKNKFGPEFRTKGAGDDSTHDVRYSIEHGYQFVWENGISTDISYRRRDISGGDGGHDNGVRVGITIPIWQKERR